MRVGRCRGLPGYSRRLPAHIPSPVSLEKCPQQPKAKWDILLKKRRFVFIPRLDAGRTSLRIQEWSRERS